jgi:chromosome segregation ATPase
MATDRGLAMSGPADETMLGAGGGDTGGLLGASGKATMGTFSKPKAHDNFRHHNVRFLQEQHKEATRALDALEEERDEAVTAVQKWEEARERIEMEYKQLQKQLAETEEKRNISAAEIHKRDEQIRVLSTQNRELLDMLEQEEKEVKVKEAAVREASELQDKLQNISDQYDKIKEIGNRQLTSAYTEIAKYEEELRNARSETEQLKEAEINFAQQAKTDIEALEQKLKMSKDTNVGHLQQIQHNEVHEHRLQEGIQRLKETLDELTVQKKGVKMQLDMDVGNRDKWIQSKAEVERRKDALEKTVQALRGSLREAEDANQRMQEENKAGSDNFRQLGDKVYALMDQLRQHQLELKKQEQGGIEKQKRVQALDKQAQLLQDALQSEVDAKLAAEAEARNAAQMQALLQKKNRMLEEAYQLALRAQEKVEKRLQELSDKAGALQTQNDYLTTRIDGNEEDKGALRYEMRRSEDERRQAAATNSQLQQERSAVEDKHADADAAKISLKAELDYIKREDMLDETGRTKPILIESESKLIERLQINEFLFSAQQARNPIPMLVEKVSHILEMVHTAQTQADAYLQDLQRSNTMLTALRQKNMTLYEKVQMCETWKMRALLKIASNEFEQRADVKGIHRHSTIGHRLYLDSLQYSNKELVELHKVISNYGKAEQLMEIHLQDNQLQGDAVPMLTELVELCPYLKKLDLRKNRLDTAACDAIKSFVERIPGVTTIARDPVTGNLTAKSGMQVRMVVLLEDQAEPNPHGMSDPTQDDLMATDGGLSVADDFLKSGAGVTAQSKLQGPDAPGYPGAGQSRGVAAPQRGTGTLPKIGR